jgi:hypothetical protein
MGLPSGRFPQVRPRPDPVQLAFDPARQLSGGVNTKDLKLNAGRPRIDDKDGVHQAAANPAVLRRASA